MDQLILDENKIRFLLIPSRFPSAAHKTDYVKAYACWKEVWNMALRNEMNVKEELYSDGFTRQSHIAVIFYDNEVVCLTTLNFLDLSFAPDWEDSYFKVLPEITRERLKKEATHIIVAGNFTLNFAYRKGAYGISWKDLMLIFQIKLLKSTAMEAVIGAVRLEKGMEKAAYRTGAYALARNLDYTIPGQKIDLVCWHRNLNLSVLDPHLKYLADFVWSKSTSIIENFALDKGVKDAA